MATVIDPDDPEVQRTNYSSISLHRRCPQAWFYKYERGLDTPREGNVPYRDFGTWWHAVRAADALERGRAADSLLRLPSRIRVEEIHFDPKTVTAEEVHDAAARWWRSASEEVRQRWLDDVGTTLPQRLRYVDEEWRIRYGEDIEEEVPLLVEQWWDRSVSGVKIGGFVDLVYYDTVRRIVVVRDNKSAKTLGTQSALDDMMDSQLQMYAWGVAPLVKSVGHVRAVSYDRVATPAPKTPVLTQSGTLSKTVTSYDLRTYLAFAAGPDGNGVPYPGRKKDGSGAGVYTAEESEIERLSSPKAMSQWFQRTRVPINMHVVKAHLTAAVDTAREQRSTIVLANERGFAPRNLGDACRWCAYRDLCRAELVGGPGSEYDPAEFGLVESRKR